MEISIVSSDVIKIRGKSATFLINGTDAAVANAVLLLGNKDIKKIPDDAVIIDGAGDYEISGIKISGIRSGSSIVYTMVVDRVSLTIGSAKSLEALQKTLPESSLVLVDADEQIDAGFITNLSPAVVLFYDEHGVAAAGTIAKENLQTVAKYQVTAEKIPLETEIYLLASSK